MRILDYFYENPPECGKFIDRKVRIDEDRVVIFGGKNTGKSYLLINALSRFKRGEFLYLNFEDIRLNSAFDYSEILDFIGSNEKIKAVGIDGLSENLDEDFFGRLNLEKIIVASRRNDLNFNGFAKKELRPLTLEEFIAFDKRRTEINSILSAFFLQGNGVRNSFLESFEVMNFEQNLLKSELNSVEISLLKECANQLGLNFSANKIYTNLKNSIKISKDSVYKITSELEILSYFDFLANFDDEKAAKRLYFTNLNLKDCLGFQKDFSAKFKNALYCELANLGREIYYTKELDFYIPSLNMGILVVPFSASEIVFLRFKKLIKELKARKIVRLNVISMNNSGSLEIQGIRCEVVPFWQFALSF